VAFRHHHTTTNPSPLALAQSQCQFDLKTHLLAHLLGLTQLGLFLMTA
jgi:hypothetical protein